MLLADEFESITLPGGTTQVLGPVDLDAFSIFEDLCLLDNRERLQLEDLHTTFVLELIKRVLLTNYHQPTFPQGVSYSYPSAACIPAVFLKLHTFPAFEILFLLQHRLFPLLSKTRSERSAYQPPIRDTHVVFLLFKQFSSQLEMEAELIPTVLTKLVNGEADAGELGPVGARDGDHEQVRVPSIPHFWHTGLLLTTRSPIRIYMSGVVAMPSSGAVFDSVTMPWQPTVAPAAPLAHASLPPSYPSSGSWSPHVLPCSASPRRCMVWV